MKYRREAHAAEGAFFLHPSSLILFPSPSFSPRIGKKPAAARRENTLRISLQINYTRIVDKGCGKAENTPAPETFIRRMKNKFLFLCLAPLLSGTAAFAQTTVTTDPVGFINETVAGALSGSPQYTFISPTLTNPIAFQGTIASITSTTITINGASFTADQFDGANGSYYVEVFNATNPGALADITGTSSNSVTVDANLTSFASAGDSIRIRQHVTLGQLLGANNTYGFQSNANSQSADLIIVYNGVVNDSVSQTTYFYYPADGTVSASWMDTGFNSYGTPGGANGATIAPFQGIIIKRIAAGNITITSTGTVKTGNTLFPVFAGGSNVMGTASAQGLTLGNSGLYTGNASTGLQASSTGVNPDQIIIYNGQSQTTYFYYAGDGSVPAEWMDTGFNLYGTTGGANSQPIAPGTSFIVQRFNGAAFNWVLPSPSSF